MPWRGVAAAYPNDREASIFYALSLAAAAPPTDKTYADQRKAGAILERLLAAQPDHPGLAHYIIHAYDAPPLAEHALSAARRYSQIAPSAPHALHMPSHTFTRLGQWQESIDANLKSGEVARREGSTAEELHTMDYRAYAYLQTGQDDAARRLVDALPEVRGPFRSQRDRFGRTGLGGRVRAGGDTRAVRARAGRLGRGGATGRLYERFPVHRGADLFRAGAGCLPYERHRHRAGRDCRTRRHRTAG